MTKRKSHMIVPELIRLSNCLLCETVINVHCKRMKLSVYPIKYINLYISLTCSFLWLYVYYVNKKTVFRFEKYRYNILSISLINNL